MELISDRPGSPTLASGALRAAQQPSAREEFTVHLPRLLSCLEDRTTCGVGTGFTTDFGVMMEDSGAAETASKGQSWQGRLH